MRLFLLPVPREVLLPQVKRTKLDSSNSFRLEETLRQRLRPAYNERYQRGWIRPSFHSLSGAPH
jgi:hypothetical protein